MTNQKSAKRVFAKFFFLILAAGITVAAFVFSSQLFGENSVFLNQPFGNQFLNAVYGFIPDAIRTVQIITIAAFINLFIRFITSKSFAKTNRSMTVVKLINNMVRWLIMIVTVLVVLAVWGVDVTTLIASAGVLTLVIGLGAQSLVADIVAGIFIVCEGEFLVGDIVVIDDCRGTVQEIGVRTTKIVDSSGNVKIINNSEIKSVMNQTQELSVAKCTVGIEYGESLERVEKVIENELPAMSRKIADVVEGPQYKGVSELGASSVNLLFIAKCREENLYQVQRDLNREIKLLFDRNNINIPFPQVVVNEPPRFKKASAPRSPRKGTSNSAKKTTKKTK